jgi:hypothetical protein
LGAYSYIVGAFWGPLFYGSGFWGYSYIVGAFLGL